MEVKVVMTTMEMTAMMKAVTTIMSRRKITVVEFIKINEC